MSNAKQVMDLKCYKSVSAAISDEHQRNWDDDLFERKVKDPDHNYDRSRLHLNFQVGRGGVISPIDKSRRINDKVDEIIATRLKPKARVTVSSNRAVLGVFNGNRERMRQMAFGNQTLNEFEETNSHLIRQPEIEQWAKDIYGFVAREFGEENIASFVVHLDELNPHVHCVFVPITPDGRLSSKDVLGGATIPEASRRMAELHSRLAVVNAKYGLERGDSIRETGARHRSTAEYNRDLHRENEQLEAEISDKRSELKHLRKEVKKAEKRVKSLSTMITNLETQREEINAELTRLQFELDSGAGDVDELQRMIQLNQKRLAKVQDDLADKNEKLATARIQLKNITSQVEVTESNLKVINIQLSEVKEDYKTHIRMRLTDSVFAKVFTELNRLIGYLTPEQKSQFGNAFLMDIAERPAQVVNCAMLLYAGYFEGAVRMAESAGGGGSTDNDLKWGRDPDEDDRKFAFRCMQQAHRMLKPVPARTVRRGR